MDSEDTAITYVPTICHCRCGCVEKLPPLPDKDALCDDCARLALKTGVHGPMGPGLRYPD
ncbi:MAG: hypothetical protein NVS1B14_04200 [Vulcanimicrobiaceae bacterium]